MLLNKKNIILLVCLLCIFSAGARTRKVLFIGNSFIFTNDMPGMLRSLAASMGDTLVYDQNTIGGYTLQMHSTDATTITKIFSQAWDVVVIQEQSQIPSFPPSQVATDCYPYAHTLDSMVHANNACTRVMFMMTWGYKNGDASNCASYPVICTYEGMQMRLRESYMQMAQDNAGLTAPIGAAWKVVRDSFPAIDLYSPDEKHPGAAGTYLGANVLYASIFHRSSVNSTYVAGLTATDAATLRRIADKVTLDSLNQWQQYGNYPFASFSYTVSGDSVITTNHSASAATYHWDMGDGSNSTDNNVVHKYAANGTYIVSLTASNSCFSETETDTVHIGTSAVGNVALPVNNVTIANAGDGVVHIGMPATTGQYTLHVYDMMGRNMGTWHTTGKTIITAHFMPGIYCYHLTANDMVTVGKFGVY